MSNHLGTVVIEIEGKKYFGVKYDSPNISPEIVEQINHPGYILVYNYTDKIYKLIFISHIIKNNLNLVKHVVGHYLDVGNKKNKLELKNKLNSITKDNYRVLKQIFTKKFAWDPLTMKIITK
jgi:hypothetical protein